MGLLSSAISRTEMSSGNHDSYIDYKIIQNNYYNEDRGRFYLGFQSLKNMPFSHFLFLFLKFIFF